jgi:hypothetical protein
MANSTIERKEDVIYLEPASFYDKALIGHADHFCSQGQEVVAVYDADRIIRELETEAVGTAKQAGEYDEEHDYTVDALEHYEYNIVGSYVRAGMPVFVFRSEEFEDRALSALFSDDESVALAQDSGAGI